LKSKAKIILSGHNFKIYNVLRKLILINFALFFFVNSVFCQAPSIIRGDIGYHTYDRAELVMNSDSELFSSINNYNRKDLVNYFMKIWADSSHTEKDRYDILHIFSDNLDFLDTDATTISNEADISDIAKTNIDKIRNLNRINRNSFIQSPILKHFYISPSNFLQHESSSLRLFINPIINITYFNEINNNETIFQNTRGIQARGYIDEKVYFFTQLLENQRNYLSYVEERILQFGTLPGQGSIKKYNSSVFSKLNGYDFFNARAYFGFKPFRKLNIEFGHGNHFIGNGIRSLFLSDYSHNYLYLRSNFKFGMFQYQNILMETSPPPEINSPGNSVLPKKYMAINYLAFKPSNRLELGLFESTVFQNRNGFKLHYLNPLLLYRTFEHIFNGTNNVLLGLSIKWNPIKSVSCYGQLITNEFNPTEVLKKGGIWTKRIGAQIGLKYVNLINVDHLDFQIEYNAVNPYTFASSEVTSPSLLTFANYTNFNQPLAHVLGANFKELILLAKYKPTNRTYVLVKYINTIYGTDIANENWGGNILLPLNSRKKDFDNFIGQGQKTVVKALNFDVSYEFFHNYYLDFHVMLRQTATSLKKEQHYYGGGIRVNIANLHYDY